MGLISFIKDAGEKIIQTFTGSSQAEAATPEVQKDNNDKASEAVMAYIAEQNLSATGLMVDVDTVSGTAKVFGVADDQQSKEKILLCAGNVAGIQHVDDNMSVRASEPATETRWHDVKSGDTLWQIAQAQYGDGNKYMAVFEANQPMLSHPDKIYPGQKLRIPEMATA